MVKLIFFLLVLLALARAEHWAVRLDADVNAEAFAIEHSLRHIEKVGSFDIFESFPGKSNRHFHAANGVLAAQKQVPREQFKRSINTNDPLYPSQWHLSRVKAPEAWAQGLTGKGVKIAIVDDGLQILHPDLASNVDRADSWDFNGHNGNNPSPTDPRDGHGTSAAGVAAAVRNNGHCGAGVAPEARLAGIRLIAGPTYDYVEAQALSYHNLKIYSCSWGPADAGTDLAGPGPVTREALKHGFGRGSVYLWAGGNGARNGDATNYDGYANSIYTIAIGAINHEGKRSSYSESGACLFAVTPSSGARRGIVTTDLTGSAGYTAGECTMNFGGTSSATPLAAGITAILLQKNPALSARQIMHIFASGATKVGDGYSAANERGYSHSPQYGFGLLVIPALLKVPSPTLAPLRSIESGYQTFRDQLPVVKQLSVKGQMDFIEQVEVYVSFYSNYRGQISITLISPSGVESRLAESRRDAHRGLTSWTYTSVRHWGEQHKDGWKVRVEAPRGTGAQLRGIGLRIWGS